MMRFKVQAIIDAEVNTGLARRINHGLTILRRGCHRFFTHHMLARFCRCDGVSGVKTVGSDDMNDVNIPIVGELGHLVVGEDVFFRKAVLCGKLSSLPLRSPVTTPAK